MEKIYEQQLVSILKVTTNQNELFEQNFQMKSTEKVKNFEIRVITEVLEILVDQQQMPPNLSQCSHKDREGMLLFPNNG